ncbi:MAG: histidine kinase N-terminal 7TM domain-containing protein [Candidatus Paceibacterota bacterium]|jgi:hypothetical protein
MFFWEYYILVSLVFIVLATGFFGVLVFLYDPKNKVNILCSLMNISVIAWAISWATQILAKTPEQGLFWGRALDFASTFIPLFFFHWIIVFLKEEEKPINKILLYFGYAASFFYSAITFTTPYFINLASHPPFFTYYPDPGILHPFWVLTCYTGLPAYACFLLLRKYLKTQDSILKNQIKYMILGASFGFIGGGSTYLLFYDIQIPPFAIPLVIACYVFLNYAMIRYRMMDISIVIGKTGIYLFSLLAVGIWTALLAYLNQFFVRLPPLFFAPIVSLTSIGVFYYSSKFFEKIAEKYFYYSFSLLKNTIENLTKQLNTTISLEKILAIIDRALLEALKIDKIGVILKDPEEGSFSARHLTGFKKEMVEELTEKHKIFLINFLNKTKDILVKEEIPFLLKKMEKEKGLDTEIKQLKEIEKDMDGGQIDLIIPLSIGDMPIGAVILGKKSHKAGYSSQELGLLNNFSAQASIALNNAIALDQVEKRKTELEKFYKLTIGRELRMAELKEKIKELENIKK